ncbi:MAG: hypothetical protein GX045_01105 [Clostridiaceae bacterium]|nr:hypothetical protein [Clostridiaceae bacterium]
MSIILSILIAFAGIMADLSRLETGKKHAQAAVQLSLQSALTRYHAPLKERYGIMSTNQSDEELEVLIWELLEKNLAVENRYTPGIFDLYGFEVKNVKVISCFNMTEDYVLEQQIAQFMKYRAPVNTLLNFVEKLKSLNTFMAQSGLLNKKMDLEKKLQKIREEQVYLSLLLSLRIKGFYSEYVQKGDIKDQISSIYKHIQSIKDNETDGGEYDSVFREMPCLTDNIAEVRKQINNIKNSLSYLENDLDSYKSNYRHIERSIRENAKQIDKLKDKIKGLEKSIDNENKKQTPDAGKILDLQKEIVLLEKETEKLSEQNEKLKSDMRAEAEKISDIKQEISEKDKEIKKLESEIDSVMALLKNKVNTCLRISSDIHEKAKLSHDCLFAVKKTVNKYINYHQQALSLTDKIEKGAKAAEGLISEINTEISKQREKSDNSFLMRIKADMEKLILNADPSVLDDIREKLKINLDNLEEIQNIIESTNKVLEEQMGNIDKLIKSIEKITDTCSIPKKENFGEAIENQIKIVENKISEKTKEYIKPSYNTEPKINKREKNEFFKWCNKVFNEDNNTDNSKDKGQQKKLKQNIEKTDKENKDNQASFNGGDKDLSDKELNDIFARLPSFKDKDGNYINVKNSDFEQPNEKDDENALLSDKESKKTDIEEKYGGLLNQNGSFSARIGQALSGASDALIKSLYVNEFIVGAFKNANIDTVSAPVIRPDSFSEESFFEKAEVEYIIFGAKREKTNANLASTTIFGIRMGLNLIHVYTNPDKTSAAFTAASAIAGWSGFGVPIVKNLILIGWAAGESWLDIKDINAGKPVPIYKTQNTWKLNLKSLFSDIADQFLDESTDWLKQYKNEMIDKGDDALQTVVRELVCSAVQEAFVPLEQAITDLGEDLDMVSNVTIKGIESINEFDDLESLKKWISKTVHKQYESIKEEGQSWTKLKIEEYKKKITDEIVAFIFKSSAYKNFVAKMKDGLDGIIEKGADKLADSVKKLGNGIKDTGIKDQIVGTVVSFDYIDYLRILLLVVPQRTKLLRTSDLMQLNMQKLLDNPGFCLSDYNSFLIVEADISMKYLFLPIFTNNDEKGQIKIRWGYGY